MLQFSERDRLRASPQRHIPANTSALWARDNRHSANSVALLDFNASAKVRRTLELSPLLPKDVSSRFGRRLRKLRLERYMTQSDMAKKFGIDRSFISDLERGRKSISLHTLEVIAIGMGISLSKLFEDI